jgi:uncharacterized membrane protein
MIDLLLYQLRTTLYINSKTYTDDGKYFYYSKITLTISLLINIAIISFGVYLLIGYDIDPSMILVSLIFILLPLLFAITDVIPKLLYRNPIFIISNTSLFYTKNETTYDINTSHFIKYKAYRQFFFNHIRIQQRDRTKKINEDLFDIKNARTFCAEICKIKGVARLPNKLEAYKDFYDLTN